MPNTASCCWPIYSSGFSDQRALSFVNLHMYGGGFDMAADLLAKFLPLNLFETRRLAGGLIGVLGLAVTWRLARRIGGPVAGFVAVVLLAACPMFFGHMLMNAKDAPFAVAMTILLLALVRLLVGISAPARREHRAVRSRPRPLDRIAHARDSLRRLHARGPGFARRHRSEDKRNARSVFARGSLRCLPAARVCSGLCRHGGGLAVVGAGAAQSLARAKLFLPFLRTSLARAVRRPADPRSRHAAQLCADTVCAADAGNLFGAGSVRPAGGLLRRGAARSPTAATRHFPLRRHGRGLSHRAHGRGAAGDV